MLPFLLALGLFVFLAFVGYPVVAALRKQRNVLQDLLLAPLAGLSAVVIPVFLLNRAAIPVEAFATYVALGLPALAIVLAWRVRPVLPWRQYRPFAAVLALAMLLSAWPMFLHGFDWTAYCNGDMLTLSNAAQYMLHNGLFDGPKPDDLAQGRDYSQYAWYQYAVGMHRLGNEVFLAFVSAVSRLRPDQAYMSMTVALHAMLISAAGALVLRARRLRLAALLTCLLLAFSALSTQAVVNQLPSQIGGLAFLAGTAALLLRPYGEMGWRRVLGHAGLVALIVGGMLLYYPEMSPFLGLSFAIYVSLAWLRGERSFKTAGMVIAAAALVCVALLNTQIVAAAVHVLSAFGASSTGNVAYSQFPFFLKPVGLAIFWGLSTFNYVMGEPWISAAVALGGLLLLTAIALTLWQAYHRMPAAIIAVIMLGLAVHFFFGRSDFGLFKLAFYIQPFMLAAFVVGWLAFARRPAARIAPLVVVALAGFAGQTYYTMRSADLVRAPVSIWKSSTLKVKSEFEKLLGDLGPGTILADTPNFTLVRFQALAARGRSFLPTIHMERLVGNSPHLRPNGPTLMAIQEALRPGIGRQLSEVNELEAQLDRRRVIAAYFDMKRARGDSRNEFRARRLPRDENAWLLAITGQQSIFNRRQYGAALGKNYVMLPLKDASDYLSFVPSNLGQYYFRDLMAASFWQLEPDYFYAGASMSGAGAVFLFQVVNPSASPRLVLEVTSTLNGDMEHRLPPAAAIGEARVSFPIVGRGSARVFSPPLRPQRIEGAALLAVDMNAKPKPFPPIQSGLLGLYGADYPLDRRFLVGFIRDISLVSDAQYRSLEAPRRVREFPQGLANPSLEYSGVYEDGWLSEAAYFMLGPGSGSEPLRLEGTVPRFGDPDFSTELEVLVDGRRALLQNLRPGRFKLTIPVDPAQAGRRRIDLRFSRHQRVPGKGSRVVTAKLFDIGF